MVEITLNVPEITLGELGAALMETVKVALSLSTPFTVCET